VTAALYPTHPDDGNPNAPPYLKNLCKGDGADRRFQLPNLLRTDGLYSDPIAPSRCREGVKRRPLFFIGRHDQLANTAVGHTMLGAEAIERVPSFYAEAVLQAAGRVIEPGMDDLAIA